ncbi:MAG: hypothetical protein A2857_06800 [Candidatus Levybacteria bacterium RIFCSPHIGHO2_01_FULL_36_15]|nr:MAG: hypothetical protein A2857_06800 [Candidatus Levybacteria bacterium RIFCSPHIGHO2_01_FULL_36_15]OGH37803.1 MAG: hypothetical protein A2905_00125 [Candidatus Levybacteria bacterium RIFCSPLOWO2_01_FULL_36_10]
MAYEHTNKKGTKYYLNSKLVTLRGGKKQTIYYFSRSAGQNSIDKMPEGYKVVENERTGLPVLKKK